MNVKSINTHLMEQQYIVRDINVSVEIDRPTVGNNNSKYPNLKLNAEVSGINITLSEYQYALLLGILQHNFRERSHYFEGNNNGITSYN
jgi:hypothetical protein